MNINLKTLSVLIGFAGLLSGCGQAENQESPVLEKEPTSIQSGTSEESRVPANGEVVEKSVKRALSNMTAEQMEVLNKTAVTAGRYPEIPEPSYGPEYGSITFVDTDPGPTIGGTLTMKPAVDEAGKRVNEADLGITRYSIQWGLEVGLPGIQDDKGAGDLGGECMSFRNLEHIVTMEAERASDVISWEIPAGTTVPEGAVYFVGRTHYGKIYNLKKCTQIPIVNFVAD